MPAGADRGRSGGGIASGTTHGFGRYFGGGALRLRDEWSEIAAWLRLTRRGKTVAETGAYKGAYLCWRQRAVGPAGGVCALKP